MAERVEREGARPLAGDAAWIALAGAPRGGAEFYRAWLALQCRMIPGAACGVVLVGAPGARSFAPAALWPEGRRSAQHLAAVIERALAERRGVALRREEPDGAMRVHLAHPIQRDGALAAIVALDLAPGSEGEIEDAQRRLQWGAAWIEIAARRVERSPVDRSGERLQVVLDLVASALAEPRFRTAATAFATAVAGRLDCDRVSVGFAQRGHLRVAALSHSASFAAQATLVRAIGAAMDEAADQRAPVAHPAPAGAPARIARAHQELSAAHGGGAVCTVPLTDGTAVVGALTLERPAAQPFDAATVELCEALAAVAGPLLELRRRDDRWLGAKALDAARGAVGRLVGPRHVGLKLTTLAVLGAAAFLAVGQGTYRVSARTVMEAGVRRAAVAPVSGFIKEAPVRAGDVVAKGQALAVLDDRDLRLERVRLRSQEEQYARQRDQALAARNAAQVQIASAQIAQAQAQIALLDEQIGRARVTAEFDGVVVTGDLSQSLGSPVNRGDVLFEVAPLDAYRVVLQVDERDIADVRVGQAGRLLLAAAPADPIPFRVGKITPVSTAREGRNYFRVEAQLERAPDRLRPGLEGVGKIDVDERRLVAIWTRQLTDWARLALWTWLP